MGIPREPGDRSDAGRVVLLTLRREGPLTPDDLAARLSMSRLGTLRLLRDLVRDGHVERRPMHHGVGRPRHVYQASPLRDGTIPGAYEDVVTSLLDATRDVGGHVLLAKIFDARSRAQAVTIRERLEYRGLAHASLFEQVRELAVMQDDLGFAPEVEEGERGVRLREYNCPIFRVVERSQAACEAEAAMLGDVLHASVTRESHILAGANCCSFWIERRLWDSSQMAPRPSVAPPSTIAASRGWTSAQMRVGGKSVAAPGSGTPGSGTPSRDRPERVWDARQMAWKPRDSADAADK